MALLSEEERIAALDAYDVLDTPPEDAFDELTQLASRICQVPIALVSLVDRDRQWFKSCVGIAAGETPRAVAFCAHAILRDDPLIVSDARSDPRFLDNPLVTGAPFVRFYAGFPLIDEAGAALGTLCVIDRVPRELDDLQMTTLRVLAKQVVAQLHLRRATAALRTRLTVQTNTARVREEAQEQELTRARELREQVDRAHHRAAFLADAGKLLSASLDADRTLDSVARMAVPRFADLCSIVVCGDDGELRRVADCSRNDDGAREMQGLREDPQSSAAVAMREAIDRAEPVLFTNYVAWLSERLLPSHPYLMTVQRLEVQSAMSAPMIVAGRVRGVLSVALQKVSGRTYTQEDAVTLGELAQRAGVALENARLFGEAQCQRARAEAANRSKDEFLAAVSHELRTPLSAVLGWVQLLRQKGGDETLRARGLEVIERSVRSQSRLIEELLDVSRIVSGHLVLEREPIDLVAVVEAAVDALRPAAAARRVELVVSLDAAAQNALGDAGRLEQVVWNIVTNAIKFSSPGGSVALELRRSGIDAELSVRDHGRGISAELLPKIFDRFQQDDDGVGRRLGGLGLGLAIAKHIIEALGGTIKAESAGPGHGATFHVRLPLARAAERNAPPPAGRASERNASPPAGRASERNASPPPARGSERNVSPPNDGKADDRSLMSAIAFARRA